MNCESIQHIGDIIPLKADKRGDIEGGRAFAVLMKTVRRVVAREGDGRESLTGALLRKLPAGLRRKVRGLMDADKSEKAAWLVANVLLQKPEPDADVQSFPRPPGGGSGEKSGARGWGRKGAAGRPSTDRGSCGARMRAAGRISGESHRRGGAPAPREDAETAGTRHGRPVRTAGDGAGGRKSDGGPRVKRKPDGHVEDVRGNGNKKMAEGADGDRGGERSAPPDKSASTGRPQTRSFSGTSAADGSVERGRDSITDGQERARVRQPEMGGEDPGTGRQSGGEAANRGHDGAGGRQNNVSIALEDSGGQNRSTGAKGPQSNNGTTCSDLSSLKQTEAAKNHIRRSIVRQARQVRGGDTSELSFRLHSGELGRLEVQMKSGQGKLDVHISVPSSRVRAALEGELAELEQSLEDLHGGKASAQLHDASARGESRGQSEGDQPAFASPGGREGGPAPADSRSSRGPHRLTENGQLNLLV